MSFQNKHIPVPIFTIDDTLHIIDANDTAISVFPAAVSFTNIIEEESKEKALRALLKYETLERLEVNMLSRSGEIILTELYCAWSEQQAEIIAIQKDPSILRVTEQLDLLKQRLNDTDFALFEAKEKAESLLIENMKLSAPYIEISNATALIPFFGELDNTKIEMIVGELTERAYRSTAETIIFDFTAVSNIEETGIRGLESILNILQLLGFSITISGLHPKHVPILNSLNFTANVTFIQSLKTMEK